MALTIYDSNGLEKMTVAVEDSSTQTKEIGGDNVLSLSWIQYEYMALDVNDYVEFLNERYWVMEKYRPEMRSEGEWVYNVKLYGLESLIRRFLVLDSTDEPVFTLTATPSEHVRLIVGCINRGMGFAQGEGLVVGTVEGEELVVMDYEGTYCNEALAKLAEKVDTEWWIEGTTVNVCRCEHGEELELGYGMGLINLSADIAEGVKFYTRLYPIGSSRNIDPNDYGQSRLQLKNERGETVKFVDVEGLIDDYGVIEHYEKDAFADIYPRYVGEISSVRHETRRGENGEDFDVFYVKDAGLTWNPDDYLMENEVIRMSFQDGDMAGLGTSDDHYFEVNWHEDTEEFELITIWPYDDGMQLPNSELKPAVGDKYILWNMKMPDEYYTAAEGELEEAVEAYISDGLKDVTRFKADTDFLCMEEIEAERIENEEGRLTIGSRILLESNKYFSLGDGYCRHSRVTKITRKVTLPGQMSLEMGDAIERGTMNRMGDAIEGVKSYARSIRKSLNLPDIIKTGDKTKPTDNNLYSARRCDVNYWRKDKDIMSSHDISGQSIRSVYDTAVGRDLTVTGKEVVKGDNGTEWGDGYFEAGTKGAKIWKESGGWHGQLDYLFVSKKFTVKELEVMHEKHIGGALVLSAASCIADDVEDENTTYRVWFLAEDSEGRKVYNTWRAGDLARCQTANLLNTTGEEISNHYYWRKVYSVSTEPVTRSDGRKYHWIRLWNVSAAMDEGSDTPMTGDEIVQMGSATDTGRQGVIMLAAVVNGEMSSVPYIRIYKGVGSVERDSQGNVTRGMFVMPTARIDLNPLNPHLDVAELTITAGAEPTKTIEEYIREREPEGVMVISGVTDDVPTTDSEFIAYCLEVLELETQDEMVGAFYVTTEWRIWQYQSDYTWQEVTDTNLREILDSMAEITEIKSGMVMKTDFAGLYSACVAADGSIVKTADLSSSIVPTVNGLISQATITADRVMIGSGDRRLGNYFSLDGETGNLFGQNIKLEGEMRAAVLYEGFKDVLLGEYAPNTGDAAEELLTVDCEPHVEVRAYLNEERTKAVDVQHGVVLPYAGDCEGKVIRIHTANVLRDLTRVGYWNAPILIRAMGKSRAERIVWYRTNESQAWADAVEEFGNERAACEAMDKGGGYSNFLVDTASQTTLNGDFGLIGTTWTYPALLMCVYGVCLNPSSWTAFITNVEEMTAEVELIAYKVSDVRYSWRVYRHRNAGVVPYETSIIKA